MSLSTLLFPEYRRRVLGLLLLHPQSHYHVREIARLTSTTPGTLNRELAKLAKVEILIREVSGRQVYYSANRALPIFNELVSILKKTSGLVDVLVNALAPMVNKIHVAFVYGSLARGTESSGSDIDVLIVGDITFQEAVSALYSSQGILGREINPKVYSNKEWKKFISKKDAFYQEIMNNPKLFIFGDANELR